MILITSALECFLTEGTDQIFSSLGQHRLEFYQTQDRGQSNQRARDYLEKQALKNQFSCFSTKTYVVGVQKNCLNETVFF